ncbi:hypothetical protein M9H77_03449 [Catharanthus roseus]|uniref:Uncharacterized protein n=1 Tax=Catharanthus roseus TaxID=4058 RepID=A0ACC0CBA6_CATRO|nr:hypothetical protein M9H77_03449 [Catharanthus roseus]
MHKRSLKENLQRSKRSLKTIRFFEDEVIKLKTLKTRRMLRDSFIRYLCQEEGKLEEALQKVVFSLSQALLKGFHKKGKKPPFKKGGQRSSLFKARCFEYNSTNHFVADFPKAIEMEKRALEAKLEAIKKKKKVLMLMMMMMTLILCLLKCIMSSKRFPKRNKELKNKIDDLLYENSKLVCENKTLLKSLEVLKNEKDFSNKECQKLVIENKNLCEKVLSLEKCMVDYNDLKKKVNDLTICIEKFTKGKENFEKLLGSQRSPFDKKGIGYNHSLLSQTKHAL